MHVGVFRRSLDLPSEGVAVLDRGQTGGRRRGVRLRRKGGAKTSSARWIEALRTLFRCKSEIQFSYDGRTISSRMRICEEMDKVGGRDGP